jgi:hypothetical protein
METRRIRRLERRRRLHVFAVVASVAALGLGTGLALPRHVAAAAALVTAAVVALVVLWARAEARAPSHGLTHVVRLPMSAAVGASIQSLWSRVAGTARAIGARTRAAFPGSEPTASAPSRHASSS